MYRYYIFYYSPNGVYPVDHAIAALCTRTAAEKYAHKLFKATGQPMEVRKLFCELDEEY
jgi:hypothetical protein